MTIIDLINGKIGDLDAQIARVNTQHAATIAQLEKVKAVYEDAKAQVNPGLERAIVKLQEIGLLRELV